MVINWNITGIVTGLLGYSLNSEGDPTNTPGPAPRECRTKNYRNWLSPSILKANKREETKCLNCFVDLFQLLMIVEEEKGSIEAIRWYQINYFKIGNQNVKHRKSLQNLSGLCISVSAIITGSMPSSPFHLRFVCPRQSCTACAYCIEPSRSQNSSWIQKDLFCQCRTRMDSFFRCQTRRDFFSQCQTRMGFFCQFQIHMDSFFRSQTHTDFFFRSQIRRGFFFRCHPSVERSHPLSVFPGDMDECLNIVT